MSEIYNPQNEQEPSRYATLSAIESGNLRNYTGLAINVISAFIVSVSMGINAVIFPVTMKSNGLDSSQIGIILSLEIAASLLVCILLVKVLTIIKMQVGLILSSILRVGTLLGLIIFQSTLSWSVLIFLHGIGIFAFLILLQTWTNTIPFKRFKGLMVALYSTSLSLGIAAGPLVLMWMPSLKPYLVDLFALVGFSLNYSDSQIGLIGSMLLSLLALLPILFFLSLTPQFQFEEGTKLFSVIKKAPALMFAITMAGVSYYGVCSFITLYGIHNGFSVTEASILLTLYMLGSLCLETPLTFLSDFFDRRYVLIIAVFLSIICAVFLPIAIYVYYQVCILVFLWGGIIGVIYSVALTVIGERFEGGELVAANAGYSLMEGIGGTMGIILIGFSMDTFDSDGLPYVIMLAGLLYFSFAITRYRVE